MHGIVTPQSVTATSYVPHSATEQRSNESNMYKKTGSTVYLFHGASHDVIQPLLGKDFAVFRDSTAGCPPDKKVAGKIRVTKITGDHHLEAVVVEGELKEGDISQLGTVFGLIVLTKERCETLKEPDHIPSK
jgi:hypothetical protein